MAGNWRVEPTTDFDAAITKVEHTLNRAVDQGRTVRARLSAYEQLADFDKFHAIYIKLLNGKEDPAKYLHLAGQEAEGDYYALTEHGWQILFLVDYETRTCFAISLQPAGDVKRAISHRRSPLP